MSHLLWGTKFAPPVTGRIGYVPGDGFYVEMTCFETDPLRRQTGFQVPVYLDSAMEAFFTSRFPESEAGNSLRISIWNSTQTALSLPSTDLPVRPDPVFGSRMPCAVTPCPSDAGLLETDLPSSAFPFGTDLRNHKIQSSRYLSCNFYKISEDPSIEHYAAFSPLLSDAPDFHRPEFFEKATF